MNGDLTSKTAPKTKIAARGTVLLALAALLVTAPRPPEALAYPDPPPGLLETYAGGGVVDEVTATLSPVDPTNVLVDPSGNLYIAQSESARVRKVDTSGIIDTFAGNGLNGTAGDGGPSDQASLYGPQGIARDSAGNIYIGEGGAVRRVDVTGTISTFAGGCSCNDLDGYLATETNFGSISSLAFDGSGNLYVAEPFQHRVRRISTSGIVTTVAGNGSPGYLEDGVLATSTSLNGPQGIALDSAGNLYIADTDNNRIRKVAGGVISTVAGDGTYGFAVDGVPATGTPLARPQDVKLDSSDEIWIADSESNRVLNVDGTGVITTTAGGGDCCSLGDGGLATDAMLDGPRGIAFGPSGDLYIADNFSRRVRKVDLSGIITTVAGNGTSFHGDGGPATEAMLSRPRGLVVDGSGNLFIADAHNHRVRKVDGAGTISTVAGDGNCCFSGDGVPATSTSLNSPGGVDLDSAGNLLIADSFNNRVRKVDGTGTITTVAGDGDCCYTGDGVAATATSINNPQGIALDASNNIFIADSANHRIRKVDAVTGVITTIAGNGTEGFSGDGGAATIASLSQPHDVAVDLSGNVYIADAGNRRIRKVTPGGIISTVAGDGDCCFEGRFGEGPTDEGGLATVASIGSPNGVEVDPSGNVLIAEGNGLVLKVDSGGIVRVLAGGWWADAPVESGFALGVNMENIEDLAVGPAGEIYIGEGQRVRRLTFDFGIGTPINNMEEEIPGEVQRGAAQGSPDISGNRVVWIDNREIAGNVGSVWFKDLDTRAESPVELFGGPAVTVFATFISIPKISGDWVVWNRPTGTVGETPDVLLAKQMPDGPLVTVTFPGGMSQADPDIDGTQVVWEQTLESGETDIVTKDVLGGANVTVTSAPGMQGFPRVSGNTVVWLDDRDLDGSNQVWGKTGAAAEFPISPEGQTVYTAAISGSRVVWSTAFDDHGLGSAYTCVLPCASSSQVSATVGSIWQGMPDVSGSRVVWRQCDWTPIDPHVSNCHIYLKDFAGGPVQQVDTSLDDVVTPAIDGTTVVWLECCSLDGSPNVFWRDVTTANPPLRANSLGLGFGAQAVPVASDTHVVVGGDPGLSAIELSTGVITQVSGPDAFPVIPPRITGTRVVWRDFRDCSVVGPDCRGDVYQRVIDPLGPETPVTTTALIGGPVDADGPRTAWTCSDTQLCLDNGGVSSVFTLPLAPYHEFSSFEEIRLSGTVVLWSEFPIGKGWQGGRLHAFDTSSGEDALLVSGALGPVDGNYDMSGNNVVWLSRAGGLFRTTYSFPCASNCDLTANAVPFAPATHLRGPFFEQGGVSIDGTKVSWGEGHDPPQRFGQGDIWLQDISEPDRHQVTADPRDQSTPFVAGDYIYWTDFSERSGDIFRESISGLSPTLTVDATPPAPVTDFFVTVTGSGATATLSWVNPPDPDLAGVRILRDIGGPPSGLEDLSASVVFDSGFFGLTTTAFTDEDRAPGIYYVYGAFAYDEKPNQSQMRLASEIQSTPVVASEGVTVTTGSPSTSDPVDSTLVIPAGSMSTDTVITLTETPVDDPSLPPPPSGFQFQGNVIEVQTSEPVTFTTTAPATLVLAYDESILTGGVTEGAIPVFHSDGGAWVEIPEPCAGGDGADPLSPDPCIAARDPTANTITVKTTEFSFFGLGFPPSLAPTSLTIDEGGNGIIQPGETASLAPSWTNVGAATATAVSATMTVSSCGGATCNLLDANALYGDVSVSATATCSSDCYLLQVAYATRPAQHFDIGVSETLSTGESRLWTIHIGDSFGDVSTGQFFYRFSEELFHTGVTLGCSSGSYCPFDPVPRWQMAVFIARALAGSDAAVPSSGFVAGKGPYNCVSGGASVFTDVAKTSTYCRHVHYIAAQGITLGCADVLYCPNQIVPRWQMAMFIARAAAGGDGAVPAIHTNFENLRSYSCETPGEDLAFDDVAAGAIFCRHVHFLWANEVVGGTSLVPPIYSPLSNVSRGQMAKFLALGFELTAWG